MFFVLLKAILVIGSPMLLLQNSLNVSEWGNSYECGWAGVYCDWDNNIYAISLTGLTVSGKIPLGIFPLLPKLGIFSAVNLNGSSANLTLPSDLCDANSLTKLEIYNFTLKSFPIQIKSCTQLETLHLTYTSIGGTLPDFSTNVNLKILELNNNLLTGSIPISLSSLPYLEIVHLYSNQLTGTLPYFNSTNLQILDVRNNNLQGTISVFFI